MGDIQASKGWIPMNKCQTWRRYNQWWNGYGVYSGGCYEWDYNCQL